jgi:hypothetical protein
MVTTTHIVSSNGAMEGTQIGSNVALFGTNGQVTGTNPATYSFTGTAGTTQHVLVDLVPGQQYQVKVNGSLLTTVTASANGVLSFTTTTGTQTVTII